MDGSFNLGTLWEAGVVVGRNDTKAFELYEKASELGHWRAPFNLATMHFDGRGTPKNCSRAAKLFHLVIAERQSWVYSEDAAVEAFVARDIWKAFCQYLILGAQGSESGLQNAGFLLRKGFKLEELEPLGFTDIKRYN